ncbi:MAG TPA: hypothetical protein VLX90_07565, partial [Steroidobacteraceae bacterium]|nr:hypothetical protein [Steroidobacteraceae bacterium]
VYLDAGYDWSDPDFRLAHEAQPAGLLDTPDSATKSLDAYREYERRLLFPGLDDMSRVEAYLRESVVVQGDGRVAPRMSEETGAAIFAALWQSAPLNYRRVKSPALAFYARSILDSHLPDARARRDFREWERRYMGPFREKSIERIQRELVNVQVIRIPGSHNSFFLTSKDEVVGRMRAFLGDGSGPDTAP